MAGTGVVHFISNKMRMTGQADHFDGEDACALLIPVMELSQAKSWQGEAYYALFVLGLPSDGQSSQIGIPNKYTAVQLSTTDVMDGGVVKDATNDQIEVARMTLIHAVLALRSLVSKMTA